MILYASRLWIDPLTKSVCKLEKMVRSVEEDSCLNDLQVNTGSDFSIMFQLKNMAFPGR
jgi:hypothetical protein